MKSLTIGKYTLERPLFLAPMAGVTDYAFRSLCREMGAAYTVSEMVSAKALCYEQKAKKESFSSPTAALAAIFCEDMPMAIQIFGHEPEIMAEAAAMLEKRFEPHMIDINMGCPVNKIF